MCTFSTWSLFFFFCWKNDLKNFLGKNWNFFFMRRQWGDAGPLERVGLNPRLLLFSLADGGISLIRRRRWNKRRPTNPRIPFKPRQKPLLFPPPKYNPPEVPIIDLSARRPAWTHRKRNNCARDGQGRFEIGSGEKKRRNLRDYAPKNVSFALAGINKTVFFLSSFSLNCIRFLWNTILIIIFQKRMRRKKMSILIFPRWITRIISVTSVRERGESEENWNSSWQTLPTLSRYVRVSICYIFKAMWRERGRVKSEKRATFFFSFEENERGEKLKEKRRWRVSRPRPPHVCCTKDWLPWADQSAAGLFVLPDWSTHCFKGGPAHARCCAWEERI